MDGDGNVVNANLVGIPLIGLNVVIHPGESDEIELVVDTASCDPALGDVLPSGDYTLIAQVGIDGTEIYAEPVPIAVGADGLVATNPVGLRQFRERGLFGVRTR